MGTDIHGIFQAKKEGKWVDVPHKYAENRHYKLFAWLGNVRNGFGFAGTPTHEAITPLSNHRGFPEDFTRNGEERYTDIDNIPGPDQDYWKDEGYDGWHWMGDHSHSWVSAEEVLSTELPVIRTTGIITMEQFKEWDGKSRPDAYCSGAFGQNIRVLDGDEEPGVEYTHVRVYWDSNLREELGYFIDEVQRLKDEHGEVRYVFGFDS